MEIIRKTIPGALFLALLGCNLFSYMPASDSAPTATLQTGSAIETPETVEAGEVNSEPTPIPSPTLAPTRIPFANSIAEVSYILPLTIQHVTETTATLLFELDQPADGVLLYETASMDGEQFSISLDSTQKRHVITLENLTPGVEYRAEVGIAWQSGAYKQPAYMEQVWGDVSFQTVDDTEPLRVGVLGDSGFGQDVTYRLGELMGSYELDFVLHTGDVVYEIYDNSSPIEAYALKYYLPFKPVLRQAPIYPVVGNHDIEPASYYADVPFYYYAFPSFEADPDFTATALEGKNKFYAFNYGAVQFVMLDTQILFGEPGRAEQDAWLAERLADPRFKYTIPVYHVPMYSSGPHSDEAYVPLYAWEEQFRAANIALTLNGHEHAYERVNANDITHVISGGGSATLYRMGVQRPESFIYTPRTHFVLLEFYADRIELQAIAVEGEILDQTTIPLE